MSEASRRPRISRGFLAVPACAFVVLLTVVGVASNPRPGVALLGLALMVSSSGWFVTMEWRRRRQVTVTARNVAALSLYAEALRAGARPAGALVSCAAVAAPLLSDLISSATRRAATGSDLAEVLAKLAESGLPRTDSGVAATRATRLRARLWPSGGTHDGQDRVLAKRLAADLGTTSMVGASLAELADALVADLKEELRVARQVDAALGGARATAVLLCVLPVLGLLATRSLGAGSTTLLSGPNTSAVAAGLCGQAVGLVWLGGLLGRARRVS